MTPGARIQAAIELIDSIFTMTAGPADAVIGRYFRRRRYIGSKDRGFIAELTYFILRHKAALEYLAESHGMGKDGRGLTLTALAVPRVSHDETMRKPGLKRQRRDHARSSYGPDRPGMPPVEHLGDERWFAGGAYHPTPLRKKEKESLRALKKGSLDDPAMPVSVRLNFPTWMEKDVTRVFGEDLEAEMRALNTPAPVDLRTNTLKTTRDALIAALVREHIAASATPFSPWGVRLEKRGPVFGLSPFKDGWFEMQDEASQLAALLVDARPGMKVVDFCAGSGGKTLALAAAMQGKGRILAWDVSARRMADLQKRLRRAGAHNVQSRVLKSETDPYLTRHLGSADRVLVDAPCSGSGTWRRNPDLKWNVTPQDLQNVTHVQMRILNSASRLVRPGGRLVYVTCSLLASENEERVEEFLKTHGDFKVADRQEIWDKVSGSLLPQPHRNARYFRVSPHRHGMDGFFVAVMRRSE